ncbi:ABC transporter permease [Shimazuella kribbensis]|uniref:ABC transporter permease n=1 Tax=Shimazuella kribbensis TaxID=139808 RepID=UPI00041763E1|nr:FtsX-like permease family protein [Shimazuella kribbensis]
MALRKRVWRIIKENKGRYIGIFILIFLGSFYFIGASGVGSSLGNLVTDFTEKNKQEDITFKSNKPLENISELERESDALIDVYRLYDVKVSNGELRLLSPSMKVNISSVTSGRGLKNPGDILLDPKFFQMHKLKIGDQMKLNGKIFNIVGTVAIPNYIYILKNVYDTYPPNGFGIGLISDTDFKAFPEATTVYSAYMKDRENVKAKAANLYGLLTKKGYSLSEWLNADTNARIAMVRGSIEGANTLGAPVAVSVFLLCCLILGVMILRMVKSDGVVIGTLYAQGYRRGELTRHYIAIPVLLSAAGGLAGTLLALPIVGPVIDLLTSSYNVPVTGLSFPPLSVALGVLMPMALLSLSSYFVLSRVLRKSAAELMKGDEQKTKVSLLERGLRLERFKFAAKFKLREQIRSIPRLLFLLLGVSAASMLLLFGFTVNNSFNVLMDSAGTDRYFPLEYAFKEIQHGAVPKGSEQFNAIRSYPKGNERAEFYVVGLESDSIGITMHDSNGNNLPKNQVNITYLLANRLGLKVGDRLNIVSKVDGKSFSLKIGGIADTYSGQYIYMPLDELNRISGNKPGSYIGVLSKNKLDIDRNLLAGVKDMSKLDEMADTSTSMTMTGSVVLITIVSSLTGAIIIFLVTSMMIEESRSTISLMKVFGYRGKEVAKLILNSSTPVVFIGFWLGLPLMLAVGNTLYGYLGEQINMVMPMIVNPWYVLISFVMIFAVYEVTKWLCGRKLAKISMSEVLKAGTE